MHCTPFPSFSLVASFSLFHAVGRHDLLFHRSRPIGDPPPRPRPALDLDLGWTRGTCAIITSHDSSWSRLCTRTREYSRRAVSFHSFHSIHFTHSFIPLEVSVGRRRVRRRSSMSSISSRRRTATGRDDRPARSSAVMGLSRRACLSLSLAMSLSRDVSLSLARARAPSTARPRPPLRPRTRPRTRARIHARTNERTHSSIHASIHASTHHRCRHCDDVEDGSRGMRDARRRHATSSRVSRRARERREREERGVDLRIARPRTTTDGDAATSIRFDSISSFDFDLI